MPCTTIYGRLPPQDDSAGVDGMGCTNLSGLLMERFALLALMGSAASGLIRSSAAQALSYIRLESCALVGEPSVFTSHSVGTLGAEQKRAAPQGAAYSCLRLSKTQAIRAVLLARATVVRLKPRRAISAFSQVDCRSSCLADRLTMARAPWISWRLR